MSDAALTLNDFYLLRSLFLNETTLWTQDSLSRCVRAGYIVSDGTRLTPEGEERAQVFDAYVNELWRGVPLEVGRDSLSHVAEKNEQWHRLCYGNQTQHYQFSPHMVIFSIQPLPRQYIRHEKSEMYALLREWTLKTKNQDWQRFVPYAYQMEPKPDGWRVVCFKRKSHCRFPEGFNYKFDRKNIVPLILRIQAQYYDYVMERLPNVEWWGRRTNHKGNFEMAARIPGDRKYLGNGFAAFVRQVKTANWPIPLYNPPKPKKKEKKKEKEKGLNDE